MKTAVFFIRIFLKRPAVILSLAVLLLVTVFAFSTQTMTEQLPCALYSLDDSADAQKVISYLVSKDFLLCADEQEVYEKVKTGTADMGLVLAGKFSEKLNAGDLRNCADLVVSERTANLSTYKLMAAAAVYQQLMPFKAAQEAAAAGYETDVNGILAYSDQVRTMADPLEFDVVTVEGKVAGEPMNYDLPAGAVSIALFMMMGMLCIAMIRKNALAVRCRFSSRMQYFTACLLPQCAAVGVLLFAASLIGLLISRAFYEVPVLPMTAALAIYTVILIILFAAVSLLPIPPQILICLIAIDAAASLFLCPLYGGTNLLMNYIGPLRVMSVPYLLYHFLFL